ncbi:MAG TPA: hypothetical protein PKL69_01820 [Agitococcus sp.]|nr:hypothetical protein [Agitococcus sp.]
MLLDEIYQMFDRSWSLASRRLDLPISSLSNWRKRGGIPIKSQRRIEKKLEGKLKASFDHIGTYEC